MHAVRMSNPFITYLEAEATAVDIRQQRAICESVKVVASSTPLRTFSVPYDYLVLGVGEMPATFGTPGVRENCFFMKEVSDSVAIRKRISTQVCFSFLCRFGRYFGIRCRFGRVFSSFETAIAMDRKRLSDRFHAFKQFEEAEFIYDEDQLRQVLRFVVVGGGPTGVEFAGAPNPFCGDHLPSTDLMPMCMLQMSTAVCVAQCAACMDLSSQGLQAPSLTSCSVKF